MATYYVNGSTGNDITGDGSESTPWATIQKAISTVSTGTHHDVYVAAGTYAETTYNYLSITRDALDVSLIASGGTVTLSPSSANYAIYFDVKTGSVAFDGFAITTAASRIIRHDGRQHLTLSNCTLTGTGNNTGIYLNTASGTQVRQLTIDNCTITFPRNVIIVSGADSVTIRNSDIRCAGNYINTLLQGDIRAVSITGNTLAAPGNWLVQAADTTRITNCQQFVFDNNTAGVTTTARGGLSIDDGITNVRAIGNHLVLSHASTCYDALHLGIQSHNYSTTTVATATWTESSKTLTQVGAFTNYGLNTGDIITITAGTGATPGDYVVASRSSADAIVLASSITGGAGDLATGDIAGIILAHTIGHVYVSGNFVRFAGAPKSHAIRIGANVESGEVADNVAIGGDYQLVLKGQNVYAHHNILVGDTSVHISDGGWNKVQHNLCVVLGGNEDGITWRVNDDGHATTMNTITNNIIVASGSNTLYCISQGNSTDHSNTRCDYNCYWPINDALLANLNSVTSYSTIAQLQELWATWSPLWPDNDTHSMVADPQLANLAAFLDATNYWPLLTDLETTRKLARSLNATDCRGTLLFQRGAGDTTYDGVGETGTHLRR